jgi:ATP-dependent Clp protease ATP-binding subunit ClpC
VTELTVAQVLSEKMGVPLEVIAAHLEGVGRSRLLQLEAVLKQRVFGQDEAIERVCQRLLMAHAGLGERRGPLAVFLFLGPTGVGKTEVARLLAEFLFGCASDLIRLDMSEYMVEHNVAKLIGSPPGYVGHEEEGQLTGKLRTSPYSVVLLDEIEKVHPRAFDLFLQVFDEGRLTDAKGRTADARSAIFVMTSNIAAEKQMGFAAQEALAGREAVLKEAKKHFRSEFLNRIDEQIVFRALSQEDAGKILQPMLEKIAGTLREQHGASLHIDEEARGFLVEKGYSPLYGVRELRRTVEWQIEVPLSALILNGELRKHHSWQVVRRGDGLSIVPFSPGSDGPG